MEEVTLEIPMDSLQKLPANASYTAKSGRAGATVKRNGDTIVVYATCDSLQALVEYYEREITKYKEAEERQNAVRTEVKQSSNPVLNYVVCAIFGCLVVLSMVLIINKNK
jgi:hypothetical protein